MKFRVRYRRARVTVEGHKPEFCSCCPTRGRIEMHHWKYAYETKTVRRAPQLALDYTIGLCYLCHKMADHIKNIMEDHERFQQVMFILSYAAIDIRKEELNGINSRRDQGN